MSEDKKDFVVNDKRSLKDDQGLKDGKDKGTEDADQKQSNADSPLPEANFTALIFSLSSTALFHLGEMADPQTGETKVDLPLAKHAIDTIAMLQEKTAGNMTPEEQKFTESVLTDLRWRFVKSKK